jgi:uncharacterized membrane protein required for colicin V production
MGTLDLIIIILFVLGVLMGYRRGFILQVIHLVGFFVAYIVAYRYFDEFSTVLKSWIPYPFMDEEVGNTFWLTLFNVESMFYSALSFALLFFGTKILLQLIGRLLHLVTLLPGLNMANRSLGAAFGFLEVFIILFVLVHVMLFFPWETGQMWLHESKIALWMTEQTPVLKDQLQDLWKTRGTSDSSL